MKLNFLPRLLYTILSALLLAACASEPTPPAAPQMTQPEDTAILAWQKDAEARVTLAGPKYLHYPEKEAAAGIEGSALFIAALDQHGKVLRFKQLLSSGNGDLDEAAAAFWQNIIDDGSRFPPPPGISGDIHDFYFDIPINFCLQTQSSSCQLIIDTQNQRRKDAKTFASQARSEFDLGKFDQAILDDTRAIDLVPQPRYYLHRGWTYRTQGKLDAALADLSTSIDLMPYSYVAFFDRAVVHMEEGDYADAVDDFSKSIELRPTAQSYVGRASSYMRLKEGDKALADDGKALVLSPNDAHVYNARAWNYHMLRRSAEGLPDATKAITLSPRLATAYDTRAHLYEDLGQRDQAIADYKTALSIDPELNASLDGLKRLTQ